MQQNISLRENFGDYDKNKDKVYQQWIENVKTKHDKDLEKYLLFNNTYL